MPEWGEKKARETLVVCDEKDPMKKKEAEKKNEGRGQVQREGKSYSENPNGESRASSVFPSGASRPHGQPPAVAERGELEGLVGEGRCQLDRHRTRRWEGSRGRGRGTARCVAGLPLALRLAHPAFAAPTSVPADVGPFVRPLHTTSTGIVAPTPTPTPAHVPVQPHHGPRSEPQCLSFQSALCRVEQRRTPAGVGPLFTIFRRSTRGDDPAPAGTAGGQIGDSAPSLAVTTHSTR